MRPRIAIPAIVSSFFIAFPPTAHAQTPTRMTRTNQDIFRPVQLAPASEVRLGSGAPGADYWQQRADYSIKVRLDDAKHMVLGTETIVYTNNSPDSLDFLWLQLDQNLFSPDSRGSFVNTSNRWRGSFNEGGFKLRRVAVSTNDRVTDARYKVTDTRMRIDLEHPVAPRGGTIELHIDWSFIVPEYGADRMGRLQTKKGWVYEIAQWYPRMAVYDDINGWNTLPYLGQGEFYLEYGDFDVEITAPRQFVVVGTGELLNPGEVLTGSQQERLALARRSDSTVNIIRRDEAAKKSSRPRGDGPLTWRYHAANVRDFSWAASRAFLWDATSWDGILIMSVYPEEGIGPDSAGNAGWEKATDFARHTISHYSTRWFHYPYPVAINVAGIVGGMEYPMIVFCSVNARGQGLFGVTDHEFGHSWFPMIVGNDERRYAWMDEGFNTFINHYSNLAYFGQNASRLQRTNPDFIARRMQEPIADQPILTFPDNIRREGLGFLAYRKPGFGLVLLREYVLGPERFDRAFRTYIRRWAYKHPKPADFFRTMNEVSGEDLDWFWRGWIMGTGVLDQAVDSVTTDANGTNIFLGNHGELVMPLELELVTGNGTHKLRLPVEVWKTTNTYTITVPGMQVKQVTVDPGRYLPDVHRDNNVWEARSTSDDR